MNSPISPITMPKLGLSMTEGSVAEWHVEPGSEVNSGDVIADIETSKITNELEAHVDGVFRRSVVDAGIDVPVGTLIGIVADAGISESEIDEFVRQFLPEAGEYGETEDEAGKSSNAPDSPSRHTRDPVAIERRPSIPESLAGSYKSDDVFATPHAHKLAKRLELDLSRVRGTGRRGRVSKQDVFAAIDASGVTLDGSAGPAGASSERNPEETHTVRTTPAAKRLAAENDVDLARVPATGSRGRVSKGDVLRYLDDRETEAGPRAAPSNENAAATGERLSSTRKTIAKRLSESKRNAPHFRLSVDIRMDKLLDLRRDIESDDRDGKVSVNDLLVRAAALALIENPDVNIQFDGEVIRRFSFADVAVAVALERGLVTPVIRRAETKDVRVIARELQELIGSARTGDLNPDDVSGGSFTLSNLGMFGVKSFDAIINPPQAVIMAVGCAERRVFVRDDGGMAVGTFMSTTVSCDHRVIDGATGAVFLQAYKEIVERPGRLLL